MLIFGKFEVSCDVRVVKEFDSKSNGLCPHRFESCSQRVFFSPYNHVFFLEKKAHIIYQQYNKKQLRFSTYNNTIHRTEGTEGIEKTIQNDSVVTRAFTPLLSVVLCRQTPCTYIGWRINVWEFIAVYGGFKNYENWAAIVEKQV